MTEPENHTLHLLWKVDRDLKKFREQVANDFSEVRAAISRLSENVGRNYQNNQRRLNDLQLVSQGKTFEDYCVPAQIDKRGSALEERASRPRKPK